MRGKSTVQVMPRGVSIHGKYLRVSFQYCGKRCRESLGLHPTKANIKFAENKLASIKYEIKIGAFSYAAHFPNSSSLINFDSRSNRSAVRIIDVLDEYKPLKFADLKNATLRRYNVAYDKCLSILGSERLISAIYPEDISRLRANLINNLSASTCNHYMTVFRDFLKFIQQNGYTTKNLSNELRQVKTHRKDPDPLLLEEYNRVISSCCNEVHKNIITIMVYTGLRPGELAALSWRDIDFNRKEMTISRALSDRAFKLPKTNKPRTIILSPPAIEALKCQQKHTAMLQDIDVIIYCTQKEKRHEKIRPVFAPSTTASSDNHGNFFMASSLLNLWEKGLC